MIKLTVCGAAGRMGNRIIALASVDKEFKLVGAVESPDHNSLGKIVGDNITITSDFEHVVKNSDVIIDFTSPTATIEHINIAKKNNKPIVIGTTGLNNEQTDILKSVSKTIPVVFAPNMSIGVNLLFKLVREVSQKLSDYDIEIIESHHNQKKDSPSGTANKFAEIIAETLNRNLTKTAVYGRKGIVGARKKEEIGISSIRAGDIVGEHTIVFAGIGERIELIHRAHSRDAFVSGALYAAKWIVNKPAGIYDMQDVLGLKRISLSC